MTVSSITLLPAKPIIAPGSAICISPNIAKLAVTPPVVGLASKTMYGNLAFLSLLIAIVVLGICISEKIPSCIRAPPEDGTTIREHFLFMASSAAKINPLPTCLPIDPAINEKSKQAITKGMLLIEPKHTNNASSSFVLF